MSKVWLITGSGNGLGRDIAEAALAAGDSVIAGACRTEELAPLVVQYPERVEPVRLEVEKACGGAQGRVPLYTRRIMGLIVPPFLLSLAA